MPEAPPIQPGRPLRLGLIGYGAIGREVVAAARRGALGDGIEVAAVLTRRPREPEPGLVLVEDRTAFLAARPDVVLEGAGHAAVREHGEACLAAGADLLLTSIGALTDDALHARLEAAARNAGRRLILASAGIGALDILAGAAVGGLDAVTVTVRKDRSPS